MKINAALSLLLAIAFSCCLAEAGQTGKTPLFAPHDTARSRSVGS